MSVRRRWRQVVPMMVIWLMVSIFFWSWIFTFVTDTDHAHKLVLFTEMELADGTALALALEEGTGPAIRMVQVHPFAYAMMGEELLVNADLYVVTASGMTEYARWFSPLPEALARGENLYRAEGVPVGVRIWDAEQKRGAAADLIRYPAGEDCYLCVGVHSLHVAGLEGAVDNEAVEAALRMLAWPRE